MSWKTICAIRFCLTKYERAHDCLSSTCGWVEISMQWRYKDVIMGMIVYQITGFSLVCSTVYSDADQGKHQSSASLAFVIGNHCWPINSPHKGPAARENVSIWWRHHGTRWGLRPTGLGELLSGRSSNQCPTTILRACSWLAFWFTHILR